MRTKATLLVAASVALAVLLSFGIAVKDAKADALLFPFITKSPTVSTIISVVNTAEPFLANQSLRSPALHYSYFFKAPGTGAVQTANCVEQNFERPTSKDDIVTFDASGGINSGKKLFDDPTDYKTGNVENFNFVTALPAARAFLIVDNNKPEAFSLNDIAATNADGTLYGEAILVDVGGGAAWGYVAYNASGGVRRNQNQGVSFADGFDFTGEVIGNNEVTQAVWLPPNNIATRLFITPVDDGLVDNVDDGMRDGGLGALVTLCIVPNKNVDFDFVDQGGCIQPGIFDADENPLSSDNQAHIHCTGAVDLEFLIGANFLQFRDNVGTQGWSYITVDNDVRNSGAILHKLEFSLTAGSVSFDGTTIPGFVNNALWLRNTESLGFSGILDICNNSLPCGGGINCIHNVTTVQDTSFLAGDPFGAFDPAQCDNFPQVPRQLRQEASVQ